MASSPIAAVWPLPWQDETGKLMLIMRYGSKPPDDAT